MSGGSQAYKGGRKRIIIDIRNHKPGSVMEGKGSSISGRRDMLTMNDASERCQKRTETLTAQSNWKVT